SQSVSLLLDLPLRPPARHSLPTRRSSDLLGQRRQQGLADPVAAHLRADVEILQVDAVYTAPGGEVDEPQREAHDAAVDLGDVPVQGRVLTEQRCAQLLGREVALVWRLLVLGEVMVEFDDDVHVRLADAADTRIQVSSWK